MTNLVALPGFAAAKDDNRIPILGKFLKKSDAQVYYGFRVVRPLLKSRPVFDTSAKAQDPAP